MSDYNCHFSPPPKTTEMIAGAGEKIMPDYNYHFDPPPKTTGVMARAG